MSKNRQKLSSRFLVEHYRLQKINNGNKLYGRVTILGQKNGPPSQRIVFHQKGLKVTSAKITRFSKSDTEEILPSRINHHQTYEEVRLHSNKSLYSGKYEIVIEFLYKNGVFKEDSALREKFPSIDENDTLKEYDVS